LTRREECIACVYVFICGHWTIGQGKSTWLRVLLWETEAVEVGLDISMAMSRSSWLIGPTQPREGKVQQVCLARKTGHADLVRIAYTK
jgi:hypothetical protein